jgi:hypothetical protein
LHCDELKEAEKHLSRVLDRADENADGILDLV